MPHIYVDADACPVVKQIENVAKSHNIPVTLFCDTNHVLKSGYSEVKIIGAGADAVDLLSSSAPLRYLLVNAISIPLGICAQRIRASNLKMVQQNCSSAPRVRRMMCLCHLRISSIMWMAMHQQMN